MASAGLLDKEAMKRLASIGLWLLVGCHPQPASQPPAPPAAGQGAAPVNCRPEESRSIPLGPGRARRCVIDVGSRNVKLLVASVRSGDLRSIAGDRICRSRQQLGEKTFDQKTQTARPLGPADQAALLRLAESYSALCRQDGGEMLGAIATEWARRAPNAADVSAAFLSKVGLPLEVLSRDREGTFGYLAATRGVPGKMVLDFGSRSLQLSNWPRKAAAPDAASLPIGIDEAGDRFFGKKEHRTYAAARAEFAAAIRAGLAPALKAMRAALRAQALSPELFSLAENGDVPLAVSGRLWDASHHGVDEPTYGALLKSRSPGIHATYGYVTAVLTAQDFATLAKSLDSTPALFEELRSDRIKRIYGYKMLALPALIGVLAEDLGVETVVLVPQEMPEGLIVERLHWADRAAHGLDPRLSPE
jgi:hypothetical protein